MRRLDRAGATAQIQPHPLLPRRVRPELQTPTTNGAEARTRTGKARPGAGSHDVDAAPETGIRHRYRDLPEVRRYAACHRLHRGPRRHRHDARAHSGTRQGRTVTTASTTTARRASRPHKVRTGSSSLENDRLMPSCERIYGEPVRAAFQLFATIEVPDRARSHRQQIEPLDVQSYLPPGAFRMVIFPMRTAHGKLGLRVHILHLAGRRSTHTHLLRVCSTHNIRVHEHLCYGRLSRSLSRLPWSRPTKNWPSR